MTTERFERTVRIAFSRRIVSFMVSATNCFMAGSPNEPSIRRPKPPAKPFTPTKPTPSISQRLSVEHLHPGVAQDMRDLLGAAAFVIVIAENADHRNRAGLEVLREQLGFFRLSEIGQVACEHQHVRIARDLANERKDSRIGRHRSHCMAPLLAALRFRSSARYLILDMLRPNSAARRQLNRCATRLRRPRRQSPIA